ncbi:MAG TPA: MFS transporter permease [Actinomycetota bacterium]|nr:MFS transporter permease [Actinomycetota bacterium]
MAAPVTAARDPEAPPAGGSAGTSAWIRFWYDPVPLRRLQLFRVLIYLYVPLDVVLTRFPADHGLLPASWYAPLWIGRALGIPAPTRVGMALVLVSLLSIPLVAAAGRARRLAGPAVALLYGYWCLIGFSYGKVDHDRVALLVALAVLPTVAWTAEDGTSAAAGWAMRMVQVAVALTYFLAGVTKMLVSGPSWITSSILISAITRRGTMFADPLLQFPRLLHLMQLGIIVFELTALLMLVRGRVGRLYVWMAALFHTVTFVGITIYFRAHMICLISFAPLERLRFGGRGFGLRVSRALRVPPPQCVEAAQKGNALDEPAKGDHLRRGRQPDEHEQAQQAPAGADGGNGSGPPGSPREVGAGVAEHSALPQVHGQKGPDPTGQGG